MKIGNFQLGTRPMIIAEMSGNHNKSMENALEIVRAAANTGAHALKIQTYTPETMTLNLGTREFYVEDKNNLWHGTTLFELYKEAHTPWEWHKEIFDCASSHGIMAFSTPFDKTAVDFLEDLNVPCYKISSFENIDLPLIRYVAQTKKPLIISTGMATLSELDDAVTAAREGGCKDLVLLKCTSTYPASPENTNLLTIPHLKKLFKCEVGISDHTLGIGVAVSSVALGASVIEKHFTLDRADGGVDSTFSMEPKEFSMLVEEATRAYEALGEVAYGPTTAEISSLKYRRSLYICAPMKKGEPLTVENIRSIRPGLGLPPKYLNVLMGRKVKQDIPIGTPVSWEMLE